MTDLRTAAQQALEVLEDWESPVALPAIVDLRAALAEPVEPVFNFKEPQPGMVNLDAYHAFHFNDPPKGGFVGEMEMVKWLVRNRDGDYWKAKYGRQEPPCATRECMPSKCPNCVSLEAQNTELDRKLADIEQTSLELCEVCGWKTLIPGDCCLNCERKHPLGQASTDVPLTVYSVKKAEPVERKAMNEFDALRLVTETVGLLKSAGPAEGLIGIIRAVERAHGIT